MTVNEVLGQMLADYQDHQLRWDQELRLLDRGCDSSYADLGELYADRNERAHELLASFMLQLQLLASREQVA